MDKLFDKIRCLATGMYCTLKLFRQACLSDSKASYAFASLLIGADKNHPIFPERALIWLKQAAEQGNLDAIYAMALLGRAGHIAMPEAEMISYWRRSAEAGLADAMFRMGRFYEEGKRLERDLEEAEKWYKRAHERGYPDAAYRLRLMDYKTSPNDDPETVTWMKGAAEQDHPEAQFFLAEMYRTGSGEEQHVEKAVFWYEKAANQGFVKAQFELGMIYFCGEGVTFDSAKALKWFTPSAEAGHIDSQYLLGMIYERGWADVRQDMEKALGWYQRAAEQGFGDAGKALERNAIIKEHGLGYSF